MVVTPNGKTLYVSNAAGDVYPISTADNEAGSPIFFGDAVAPLNSAGSLSVTPNGQTVYVAIGPTGSPGIIMPIATATNSLGNPIDVSPDPISVVVAPNGKTAYALDRVSNSG
jgi:DNA-binding beta-propeller fold protein YncE